MLNCLLLNETVDEKIEKKKTRNFESPKYLISENIFV